MKSASRTRRNGLSTRSTLVRVGASALILTVPWFGQAVAGYMIDHLAH